MSPARRATTADAVTAVTVLVLGLIYGLQALREGLGSLADTGAGFFPFAVAVVLVASAVVVVVQERQGSGGVVAADEDDEEFFDGDVHWWRIVGVLLTSFAVPLIGNTVGLIVTLSVALVLIAKIMGLPGWRNAIILGIGFGAATWLIFAHWLFVPLPSGRFGLV